MILVLVLLVFLVYLPTFSAAPLFDEHYLLAWMKDLSKHMFTPEFTAYLNSSGLDARDRNGPLGNWIASIICSSGKIGFVHFVSISLHAINCVLLFIAACNIGAAKLEKSIVVAGAAIASIVFALSPLAPEAVAWAGGLQLVVGTTFSLLAVLAMARAMTRERQSLPIALAAGLALAAAFCNERALFLCFWPLVIWCRQNVLPGSALFAAVIIAASVMGGSEWYYQPAYRASEPAKIAALRDGAFAQQVKSGINVAPALVLPINKSTNVKYKRIYKSAFVLMIVPVLFTLIALVVNSSIRLQLLWAAAGCALFLLIGRSSIDLQSLYGCRWLYPILPLYSFILGLAIVSPLYFCQSIYKERPMQSKVWHIAAYGAVATLAVFTALFFWPLTFTQNSSYKSQAKFLTRLNHSIERIAGTLGSEYLLVRNLPRELSVVPMLSPFDPILIGAQNKLPLSQNVSAGALKTLLNGPDKEKWRAICVHYQKHLFDLIKTDFDPERSIFDRPFDADSIAFRLTPSMSYYKGLVKLSADRKQLLVESNTAHGASISIDCTGLSPVASDLLYIDTDLPPGKNVDLHWLTNWNLDWERRDRMASAISKNTNIAGSRSYFALSNTGFTTNGRPEQIRLGFPAGLKVAITAVGTESFTDPACHYQLPILKVLSTSGAVPAFAAFTSNYPDFPRLGLYKMSDNIKLEADLSKVEGATSYRLEIGQANSKFSQENAEAPARTSSIVSLRSPDCTLTSSDFTGNCATGSVYPIRIFALDERGAIINRASNSIYCLVK